MSVARVHPKIWTATQNTADASGVVVFPKKPSSTGETTTTLASSWGPFAWLRFHSWHAGQVNVRVYMRGVPNWQDPTQEFQNDYDLQYMLLALPNGSYSNGITVVGEIWGWNVRTAPTGLTLIGGTGAVPPL